MRARTRRRWLAACVLVAAAAAVAWWLLRPGPSDEELIARLVVKAETAVESKSTSDIMDCVAEDYRDDAGLTRADIFRLAFRWERTGGTVDVAVEDYELEVNSPRATGRFDVRLFFEEQGQSAPPLRLSLVVEFEKERHRLHREWRVQSVSGHGLEKNFEDYL
jgi:hypothetical protein